MGNTKCIDLPERLLNTLPPGKLGEHSCSDQDFLSCGHWVHRTKSPEGSAILSPEFNDFLENKFNETEGEV